MADPSIFELAFQDKLGSLLASASKYVFTVLASQNPRFFLKIVNNHDEFFTVVMLFIERYYLTRWGATFSQTFYSLKLRPIPPKHLPPTAPDLPLTRSQINKTLFWILAIPYVRSKLAEAYDRFSPSGMTSDGAGEDLFADEGEHATSNELPDGQEDLADDDPMLHPDVLAARRAARARQAREQALPFYRLKKAVYPYYPVFHLSYELLLLVYNIRYLYGASRVWRPWMSNSLPFNVGAGVQIRRMTGNDMNSQSSRLQEMLSQPLSQQSGHGLPPTYSQILGRYLRLSPSLALESLRYLLPVTIFLLKFLEWWYNSPVLRNRALLSSDKEKKAIPLQPPARLEPKEENKEAKDRVQKGLCPVHGGEVVNPTALPTGWVLCYKCAMDYVGKEGECPVTGMKCTTGELRKIVG
ncbi:hypothetical protein BT69DRAFT_1281045 [Atractiella rhizophila]|nr:hypothetical protein BT69DRAFT_1281045 [Atractiella rhizophila]